MLDTPKCICGAEEQSAIRTIFDCDILRPPNCLEGRGPLTLTTLNGLKTLWILFEPLFTRKKNVPHIFLFRFRNILVSHQAVPLTFCNKIALMVPHIYVCCSSHTSHSWWVARSTQRQLRGYNNIHSFLQRTAPIARLFVKVAPGTTFTSWSQHHFVAVEKHELHTVAANSNRVTCGSHSIIACSCHIQRGVALNASLFTVNRTFSAMPIEKLQYLQQG